MAGQQPPPSETSANAVGTPNGGASGDPAASEVPHTSQELMAPPTSRGDPGTSSLETPSNPQDTANAVEEDNMGDLSDDPRAYNGPGVPGLANLRPPVPGEFSMLGSSMHIHASGSMFTFTGRDSYHFTNVYPRQRQ
jgi:hypothetical protein